MTNQNYQKPVSPNKADRMDYQAHLRKAVKMGQYNENVLTDNHEKTS